MNAETLQSARNLEAYVLHKIDDELRSGFSFFVYWMHVYHKEVSRRKALALEYAQGTLPDRRKTPRLTQITPTILEVQK